MTHDEQRADVPRVKYSRWDVLQMAGAVAVILTVLSLLVWVAS